jgi:polysaccharide export outer membrane protein
MNRVGNEYLNTKSNRIDRCFNQTKTTLAPLTLGLFIGLFFQGCVQPTPPTAEQAAAPARTILASGDVVRLAFPGAPDLNQSQKVRTDGKLNLPLIGEVDVAGKTVASLQEDLARLYKPQLQTTTVVVTLESSATQVVISGAVGHGGKFSFERPTTIFQAIMEAGGASEFGSLKNVHLIRLVDGKQQTQILDLRPITSGKPTRPYYVRDGDIIYLPRSMF